ncbi:hypothetical protein N7451_001476 [Penicillium sp. IBT 35674x]|nr:hypothetical protein N7451_001476 [Penicillium sp. IBT 35674x]
MMAVRSPLPIISYHDTSGPYAGSDSMSFESSSASVRNSISSASDENSVDETNVIPAAPTSDGTELDTGSDDEGSVEATPVQESAPSIQPGLTIQTSHSYNIGYNTRSDDDEPPQSVIHAPPGFGDFGETQEQEACNDESLPGSQHAQLAIVPGKARKKLYDTREDDFSLQVNPTLDLCREFCQALFEVRSCDNDLTDSVLRVSFELNNHLYNTHDRNLPDAFRERTLDFYITLCHRLMKQRTRLTATDALLSACWTLAEMLFSIRQSKREGKRLDEELLGSAVQACWELCDIFREGWTLHSMRNSDRGTPRPSQTTFAQAFQQAAQQSEVDFVDDSMQLGNPETPTTIFEDTATVSPDEASVPNILVLGHGHGHSNGHGHSSHPKWPSGASSISENSRSSGHTASSANTVTTVSEDPNFTRLKVLVTKAAINSGYQRGNSQNLSSFVKSLPSDAFGSAPWQTSLLKHYRKLVAFDPAFRSVGSPARVSAVEVARACQAMLQSGQYSWLRDLYRLVFGFHMEEAMGRKGVTIQT